jgi:hypothetical protein
MVVVEIHSGDTWVIKIVVAASAPGASTSKKFPKNKLRHKQITAKIFFNFSSLSKK